MTSHNKTCPNIMATIGNYLYRSAYGGMAETVSSSNILKYEVVIYIKHKLGIEINNINTNTTTDANILFQAIFHFEEKIKNFPREQTIPFLITDEAKVYRYLFSIINNKYAFRVCYLEKTVKDGELVENVHLSSDFMYDLDSYKSCCINIHQKEKFRIYVYEKNDTDY